MATSFVNCVFCFQQLHKADADLFYGSCPACHEALTIDLETMSQEKFTSLMCGYTMWAQTIQEACIDGSFTKPQCRILGYVLMNKPEFLG